MIFLSKADSGYLWKPNMALEAMTNAEKALISNGAWLVHEVDETTDETLINHILASHCVVADGSIYVKPETEWPEYDAPEEEE